MDWSQILIVGLLLLALIAGRAKPVVWIALGGNFAATMTFATDAMAVGACDALSATLLLTLGGKREAVIALFYAFMMPLYSLGHWLEWNSATTYAMIDAIGILQFMVVARVDGGISRAIRIAGGWRDNNRGLSREGLDVPVNRGIHTRKGSSLTYRFRQLAAFGVRWDNYHGGSRLIRCGYGGHNHRSRNGRGADRGV